MQKRFRFISLCCALCMLLSCEPIVGGPCEYVDIPGTATIVSVTPVSEDAAPAYDAVEVLFDFVPDDPSAAEKYLFPEWPDSGQKMTLWGGTSLPRQWVQDQGLAVESLHSCIRSEIIEGTCTPVVFSFPDLSDPDWPQS